MKKSGGLFTITPIILNRGKAMQETKPERILRVFFILIALTVLLIFLCGTVH